MERIFPFNSRKIPMVKRGITDCRNYLFSTEREEMEKAGIERFVFFRSASFLFSIFFFGQKTVKSGPVTDYHSDEFFQYSANIGIFYWFLYQWNAVIEPNIFFVGFFLHLIKYSNGNTISPFSGLMKRRCLITGRI